MRSIGILLLAAVGLSGPAVMAKDKTPNLVKACSKECPEAKTNDDVFKCVEGMENKSGEKAFKAKHKACYAAHEKYEKATGQEDENEQSEAGGEADSDSE